MKIIFLLATILSVHGWNEEEITELATRFAPVFWLHDEELFFPSSLEFFLEHCEVRDSEENVVLGEVTLETLPTGSETSDYHLNTKQDLEDPHCSDLEVFEGESLDSIPVFTFVRPVSENPLVMEVEYMLFYPYNRGKEACVGVWNYLEGTCKGYFDEFGHHVSDWESVSLFIQDNAVTDVYVGAHGFGAYYGWNDVTKMYHLYYGEEFTMVNRIEKAYPDYPETLQVEGERPIVFVANGSHGIWSEEGEHVYHRLLQLYDNTNHGYRLDTHDKLDIYIWDHESQSFPEEWAWLGYEGRWGNLKDGCYLEWLSGECNLSDGSNGPDRPNDFPAPELKAVK